MRRPLPPDARAAALCLATALGSLASTATPIHAQRRDALQAAVASAPLPAPFAGATATVRPPTATTLAPARPASKSGRVALQWLASSAGAVAGGLATFFLLRDISAQRVTGDDSYTRSGNVGWLIGSFAGATAGAQLVGRGMGARSPVWATALGAALGTVPVAALGVDEPWLPLYGLVLGWIPQGVGATAGFVMAESPRPATPSPP